MESKPKCECSILWKCAQRHDPEAHCYEDCFEIKGCALCESALKMYEALESYMEYVAICKSRAMPPNLQEIHRLGVISEEKTIAALRTARGEK